MIWQVIVISVLCIYLHNAKPIFHNPYEGGHSTFMIEMIETSNILNNAGPHSLVLLDEVGRGTGWFIAFCIVHLLSHLIMKLNFCEQLLLMDLRSHGLYLNIWLMLSSVSFQF